ncbi:MAG: U32 family peptidase [Spirochaetaceae bacterium]|nr:U32 family peptidase [Spirochaetaceae bacterium]
MHKIELLAPAGSEDAFFAAIAAGADAVYFGTNRFNARERATNISLERLPYLTKIAHAHNVRMYMTLNIVFYDNEFSDAVELVGAAYKSGIDAVIVQDLGMISVLKNAFPDLEIHASTQMTTHNLEQCRLLAEMGVSQINLSRELSLDEIKPLAAFMHANSIVPEVFIHGAYCISYSGQCYFSGGLYGLPGNRGQCVQPCRREFCADTVPCGAPRTKEKDYLTPFNLKDNCVFGRIKELVEACDISCSVKIEGRIKSADYVYAVTSAWREQLDKLENGGKIASADERLSLSMNRGFSAGYLENSISRDMFTSGKKDHSWTECGSVVSFRADSKTLLLALADSEQSGAFAAPGKDDEVAIYGKDGSFICNASVKSVEKVGSKQISVKIAINGKLNGKIMPGQSVLRIKHFLSDDALDELKKTLASSAADSRGTGAGAVNSRGVDNAIAHSADVAETGKTAISVRVSGQLDGFLETVWSIQGEETGKNVAVTVRSETLLSAAQKRSLDEETVAGKFGRLGDTNFYLSEIDCKNLEQGVFLPLGELNEIRRKAVALLAEKLLSVAPKAENPPLETATGAEKLCDPSSTVSVPHLDGKQANPKNFRTITLLHSPDEYTTRTNAILALEIPVLFRDGVRDEYISFLNAHRDVIPYFPAILFENDFSAAIDFLSELAAMQTSKSGTNSPCPEDSSHAPQKTRPIRTVICENAGLLSAARNAGFSVVPGFHLNITNSYSIAEYSKQFECPAFIPSPETTAEQLANMTLPDNTELWLLPSAKNFLMQSRQCLVGRASGCKKAATDRECLKNCERAVSLVGRQGESIIAEKRPGFYSCLKLDKSYSRLVLTETPSPIV